MDDKALLALIAQGDKVAFAHLMQRHLPAVTGFAMRYFSQKTDAEDIAQETFTRLWCKAPVWEDKGISVKAWLFKVAYHQCIDQLRKQKNQFNYDKEPVVIDEFACVDRLMGVESDLSIQKLALQGLPERQRTAIMLCAVKGLGNSDAAAVLGISVDAMESLLARGRRKLKQLFIQANELSYVKEEDINDYG